MYVWVTPRQTYDVILVYTLSIKQISHFYDVYKIVENLTWISEDTTISDNDSRAHLARYVISAVSVIIFTSRVQSLL